jgi:hypothetical protein
MNTLLLGVRSGITRTHSQAQQQRGDAAHSTGSGQAAEPGSGEPIIDIHQHLGYGGRPDARCSRTSGRSSRRPTNFHHGGHGGRIPWFSGLTLRVLCVLRGRPSCYQAEALGNEARTTCPIYPRLLCFSFARTTRARKGRPRMRRFLRFGFIHDRESAGLGLYTVNWHGCVVWYGHVQRPLTIGRSGHSRPNDKRVADAFGKLE